MASLRLLESFANGPLHATMREAAIAAFDFAVAAAGDAPVAGCLVGAWPGAPPGSATAPGIGCVICDGESWSSALRLESGADWRCCADSELASIMAKPATIAAPIRYFRICDSSITPRQHSTAGAVRRRTYCHSLAKKSGQKNRARKSGQKIGPENRARKSGQKIGRGIATTQDCWSRSSKDCHVYF